MRRASAPTTAGIAPAAGDDGRVADQAAARGEDALRGLHAVHVLGGGLVADQDHLLALPAASAASSAVK